MRSSPNTARALANDEGNQPTGENSAVTLSAAKRGRLPSSNVVLCAHWCRTPSGPFLRRASATASRNRSDAPSPVQWAMTRIPCRSMSTTMSVMCSGVRFR
ncbi:hypothetical protein D3C77_403900 [compost metagenome]